MNHQPYIESVNPDGTLTREPQESEINLPLRLSHANLSQLSDLTHAGPSINTVVSVSGGGSDTTTSPMDTPVGTPRNSPTTSEKAYSSGWETASDDGKSISEGTEKQDVPQARRLEHAILVPQSGEMQYGRKDFYVAVACRVVVPHRVSLFMTGDIFLREGIEIGQQGIAEVRGKLSSAGSVQVGYLGRLETIGDHQLLGCITISQQGRLILPGNGACGSASSTIHVGYKGKLLLGSESGQCNLAASHIDVCQEGRLAVAGDVECKGQAALAFLGGLSTSGDFSCAGPVNLGQGASLCVGGNADCSDLVEVTYKSRLDVVGGGMWLGDLNVGQDGIFSVGGNAYFNGTVTIGYGGSFKVCGDADFQSPVHVGSRATLFVKSGTRFPPESSNAGWIKYL